MVKGEGLGGGGGGGGLTNLYSTRPDRSLNWWES